VLYGVNCIMYGLCMFFLLREGKATTVRWPLVVISTIIFLLCTVHVGASLHQLLDAFIYVPAGVPNYSTEYWLDYTTTPCMLKDYLYATLVLAQDFILIWRLYVVFMCDRRVVVFPIILAAGCVGAAYAITPVSALPSEGLYGPVTSSLIISAWAFGFALNVSVTGAIVARLWWMGRTMASLIATSNNRFASTIYAVVESGAIFSAANIFVLVIYASNSPASVTALDVASQLAALTPLLIVVQAGLTGRYHVPHGDFSNKVSTAQDQITFRVGTPRDQESWRAPSTSRSPSPAHDAGV